MWLQLLQHCGNISSCQPAVVKILAGQLVEQQQLVSRLQQRDRSQQQQIQQLQQQVSQLQQQAVEAAGLQGLEPALRLLRDKWRS